MTDAEARKIRSAVQYQQSRNSGTATRYPEGLRRQAVAYARRRQQAGENLKRIARRLGLRPQLLYYWQKRLSSSLVRPVKVIPPKGPTMPSGQAGRLVLVTPRGLRVEGLEVEGAAAMLRELW